MKVNEIFFSIQGEGVQIGLPTVFIRLSGCNLNCRWCDTQYAKSEGTEITVSEILKRILEEYPFCKRVCVTGGEPLHQLDETVELIDELLSNNFELILETNGSISLSPFADILKRSGILVSMDVKTPSSGEHDSFEWGNMDIIRVSDQLKFVIDDEDDYNFARDFIESKKPTCHIIFTTVGGRDLKWLAERVKADTLDVRVLPQLHKLIWGPDTRGV